MFVLNGKKLMYVILGIFIAIVILLCTINMSKVNNDYEETVSLPVSGKTIVVDAGHGKPDEGDEMLKLKGKFQE